MTTDLQYVAPSPPLRGCLRPAGDKSISHRLAMLLGLSARPSTITGFLTSEDCLNTLKAVAALGADVEVKGTTVRIKGTDGAYRPPADVLDMGNSGTGMRLLAGVLAAHPFRSVLTGDASLMSRPMGRIKDPLQQMGAGVELTGAKGCAPVTITGGRLAGIHYVLPMASAQVKSCTLLAGLWADGETRVDEPSETRDHTERLLRALGISCETTGLSVRVKGSGGAPLQLGGPEAWNVPADFSSAAFWMAAAAAREGAEVTLSDVGLNPRRTAFAAVLQRMGADIATETCENAWEPRGTLTIRGTRLRGTIVEGAEIPNLIDELPLVAVAGALAEGETVIRDAAELRVKESDRISAMVACLREFGIPVEELPDGMRISGGATVRGGGTVCSLGDHRIAMAGAVLAMAATEPTCVSGVACIATSYPEFWSHAQHLTGEKQ